jgi:hypothetical protein
LVKPTPAPAERPVAGVYSQGHPTHEGQAARLP